MLTGKKGWHRRINKSTSQVKRSAEFSDGVLLDDGTSLDKMENAVKKATIKTIKTSKTAFSPTAFAFAGSVSWIFNESS